MNEAAAPYQPGAWSPSLAPDRQPWFAGVISNLLSLVSGAIAVLAFCSSCGSSDSDPASICGAERPCVPEGTWTVSYDMASSGQSFRANRIRVTSDGSAEVVGEQVPDNSCRPDETGPGNLTTSAVLSSDGCTLTAEISKSWCQSGEANCEDRTITLDFCSNGSATVATGSLDACVCWINGSPFCSAVDDSVLVDATAARSTP